MDSDASGLGSILALVSSGSSWWYSCARYFISPCFGILICETRILCTLVLLKYLQFKQVPSSQVHLLGFKEESWANLEGISDVSVTEPHHSTWLMTKVTLFQVLRPKVIHLCKPQMGT